MTDYTWPDDLVPYLVQDFYLQPHTGGSESPFNRAAKIYGLSAPRWICSLAIRGGQNGDGRGQAQTAYGPRLDAMLAVLKGRQNRVALWDFRRPRQRSKQWPGSAGNVAASLGATSLTITGLPPGTPVYAGDYFGGDGRPHIFTSATLGLLAATADSSGQATVSFEPPLKTSLGLNAAIFAKASGLFRLTDDDAGAGTGAAVGEIMNKGLTFVEDV